VPGEGFEPPTNGLQNRPVLFIVLTFFRHVVFLSQAVSRRAYRRLNLRHVGFAVLKQVTLEIEGRTDREMAHDRL
jgi:hypothetical protein